MKYKVGDKVKIKTWEDMEKEYGLNSYGSIKIYNNSHDIIIGFNNIMEELVKDLNRIITIKTVSNDHYRIKESNYKEKKIGYSWSDDMIECLASEYKDPESDPVLSRFELLDL